MSIHFFRLKINQSQLKLTPKRLGKAPSENTIASGSLLASKDCWRDFCGCSATGPCQLSVTEQNLTHGGVKTPPIRVTLGFQWNQMVKSTHVLMCVVVEFIRNEMKWNEMQHWNACCVFIKCIYVTFHDVWCKSEVHCRDVWTVWTGRLTGGVSPLCQ